MLCHSVKFFYYLYFEAIAHSSYLLVSYINFMF